MDGLLSSCVTCIWKRGIQSRTYVLPNNAHRALTEFEVHTMGHKIFESVGALPLIL